LLRKVVKLLTLIIHILQEISELLREKPNYTAFTKCSRMP